MGVYGCELWACLRVWVCMGVSRVCVRVCVCVSCVCVCVCTCVWVSVCVGVYEYVHVLGSVYILYALVCPCIDAYNYDACMLCLCHDSVMSISVKCDVCAHSWMHVY